MIGNHFVAMDLSNFAGFVSTTIYEGAETDFGLSMGQQESNFYYYALDSAEHNEDEDVLIFYQEFDSEPSFTEQLEAEVKIASSPLTLNASKFYILQSYYEINGGSNGYKYELTGTDANFIPEYIENGVNSFGGSNQDIFLICSPFCVLTHKFLTAGSGGQFRRLSTTFAAQGITNLNALKFLMHIPFSKIGQKYDFYTR